MTQKSTTSVSASVFDFDIKSEPDMSPDDTIAMSDDIQVPNSNDSLLSDKIQAMSDLENEMLDEEMADAKAEQSISSAEEQERLRQQRHVQEQRIQQLEGQLQDILDDLQVTDSALTEEQFMAIVELSCELQSLRSDLAATTPSPPKESPTVAHFLKKPRLVRNLQTGVNTPYTHTASPSPDCIYFTPISQPCDALDAHIKPLFTLNLHATHITFDQQSIQYPYDDPAIVHLLTILDRREIPEAWLDVLDLSTAAFQQGRLFIELRDFRRHQLLSNTTISPIVPSSSSTSTKTSTVAPYHNSGNEHPIDSYRLLLSPSPLTIDSDTKHLLLSTVLHGQQQNRQDNHQSTSTSKTLTPPSTTSSSNALPPVDPLSNPTDPARRPPTRPLTDHDRFLSIERALLSHMSTHHSSLTVSDESSSSFSSTLVLSPNDTRLPTTMTTSSTSSWDLLQRILSHSQRMAFTVDHSHTDALFPALLKDPAVQLAMKTARHHNLLGDHRKAFVPTFGLLAFLDQYRKSNTGSSLSRTPSLPSVPLSGHVTPSSSLVDTNKDISTPSLSSTTPVSSSTERLSSPLMTSASRTPHTLAGKPASLPAKVLAHKKLQGEQRAAPPAATTPQAKSRVRLLKFESHGQAISTLEIFRCVTGSGASSVTFEGLLRFTSKDASTPAQVFRYSLGSEKAMDSYVVQLKRIYAIEGTSCVYDSGSRLKTGADLTKAVTNHTGVMKKPQQQKKTAPPSSSSSAPAVQQLLTSMRQALEQHVQQKRQVPPQVAQAVKAIQTLVESGQQVNMQNLLQVHRGVMAALQGDPKKAGNPQEIQPVSNPIGRGASMDPAGAKEGGRSEGAPNVKAILQQFVSQKAKSSTIAQQQAALLRMIQQQKQQQPTPLSPRPQGEYPQHYKKQS